MKKNLAVYALAMIAGWGLSAPPAMAIEVSVNMTDCIAACKSIPEVGDGDCFCMVVE